MTILRKLDLTLVLITLIALLGSLMIFYSTVWGPWVYSDSTEYIVSARNLIEGHGLGLYGGSGAFHPLSLHPPFYSLVLSFFGLFGANLVTAARWINIVLFGLSILLLGVTVYAYTKSSWLSVIASLLFFCLPVLVDVFSGAMSEPIFLFTGLASLCLILLFLKKSRFEWLIIAGIASGLAMLTRYSGVAFMLTCIGILLIFSRAPWKKRIVDIVAFGLLSSLPTIGWLIWLRIQSLGARSAPIGVNLGEQFTKFKVSAMGIFSSWIPFTSLLPHYSYNLARNLLIILILLILALVGLTIWKMRKNNQKLLDTTNGFALAAFMIGLAVLYLIVLAFSYLFTSPPPDLVNRTFIPVQLALLVGFFSLVLFFIRPWQSARWLVSVPIILALGISVSYLHDSLGIVAQYHQYGAGYTAKAWRDANIIKQIIQIPAKIPLISNESALVLFYTGRPAYDIAELADHVTQTITARYGDDPKDATQQEFRQNGAVLILFTSINQQFQELYGAQSTTRMANFTRGLTRASQTADGEIYFYPTTQLP
jgi:4-amino-4-deoxy-L-arabinose transferase-like glycosyltransferase